MCHKGSARRSTGQLTGRFAGAFPSRLVFLSLSVCPLPKLLSNNSSIRPRSLPSRLNNVYTTFCSTTSVGSVLYVEDGYFFIFGRLWLLKCAGRLILLPFLLSFFSSLSFSSLSFSVHFFLYLILISFSFVFLNFITFRYLTIPSFPFFCFHFSIIIICFSCKLMYPLKCHTSC